VQAREPLAGFLTCLKEGLDRAQGEVGQGDSPVLLTWSVAWMALDGPPRGPGFHGMQQKRNTETV